MSVLDTTQFPDRLECFGQQGFTNQSCTVPSQAMINFLNITSSDVYKQVYCLNPPNDSCAYGYCPNPDIASPAVRAATYISTVCLSILILYSPDSIMDAFYAQLLAVYSLIISTVIAINKQQLTRLHAVFALCAAGSPLSLYLVLYALRSMLGKVNRLEVVFGEGMMRNRIIVLAMVPLWLSVLVFISFSSHAWSFQQSACDALFQNHLVGKFFYGPFTLFLGRSPVEIVVLLLPIVALAITWPVAIYLQRAQIWKKANRRFPWRRMWRKVVDTYPFIQFCTVVLFPSVFWILTLENGALFSKEYFVPTYGQLLAIFVAVPPLIQTAVLLPRMVRWFANLTWVRFLTGRRAAAAVRRDARFSSASMTSLGSYDTLYDPQTPTSATVGKRASDYLDAPYDPETTEKVVDLAA